MRLSTRVRIAERGQKIEVKQIELNFTLFWFFHFGWGGLDEVPPRVELI